MLVHTPRLCGDPLFLEGHDKNQEPAATIECQPVVRRLQEQLPEQSAPEPDPPAPAEPLAAPVDLPVDPLAQQDARAPAVDDDDALDPAAQADDLHTALDELLDTEGTLTLVYDPDSGEIESIVSDLGEDVFIDSDLKKQLFADMVQVAIGEGEGGRDGAGQDERRGEDEHAEVAPPQREKTTEESLENLARLVRPPSLSRAQPLRRRLF